MIGIVIATPPCHRQLAISSIGISIATPSPLAASASPLPCRRQQRYRHLAIGSNVIAIATPSPPCHQQHRHHHRLGLGFRV